MIEQDKHEASLEETRALVNTTVAEVVVFGEDAVVGRALELLLGGTECRVRYLNAFTLESTELLDGVRLVILAPNPSPRVRQALLTAAAQIPVLELVAGPERAANRSGRFVLSWPCRAEKLRQRVEDAMLVGESTGSVHREGVRYLVGGP